MDLIQRVNSLVPQPVKGWRTSSVQYSAFGIVFLYNSAMSNTPEKKSRRPLLAGALVIAIGVTATFPFAFSTMIIRRAISATPLKELNPDFQSASLSLLGTIEIDNVKIHDSERHPVISADKIQMQFAWSELFAGHVKSIKATGLNMTLRPDRSGHPTLLQLLPQDSGDKENSVGFRCDQFSAQGLIITDGYALPRQTLYTLALQMAGSQGATTLDINATIPDRFTLDATFAPTEITLRRLVVPPSEFTLNAATLPQILARHIPEEFKASPLTVKVADIQWAGNWHANGEFATAGEIKNFSAWFADDKLPAIRDLNLKADRIFVKSSPASFTAGGVLIQCGSLSVANTQLGAMTIDGNAYEGNLRIKQFAADLGGGKINGNTIEADIGSHTIKRLRININNVEQHDLLKHIAPGKLDAEGRVNGAIDVMTNPESGQLQGEVRLHSTSEGRLTIGEVETLQEQIQKKLGNPALAEFVLAQLRNYPYRSGNMRLSSDGKTTELTLNYQRKPLAPGDAGYGQELEIDGRKIKTNQAAQLSNLTIALPEQSLDHILLLATGIQHGSAGIPQKPAPTSRPATAPATQP